MVAEPATRWGGWRRLGRAWAQFGGAAPDQALASGALRWAAGVFCVVVGALTFVTPYQFSGPAYALLRPILPWWGALLQMAGFGLLVVGSLPPRHPLRLATHLAAAAAVVLLGISAGAAGGWTGLTAYLGLGLGVLIAAALPLDDGAGPQPQPDLFALVIGLTAAVNGAVMLAVPAQYRSVIFDPVRPYLVLYGLGFLIGGLGVVACQYRPGLPRRAVWAAHLLLGAALAAYGPPVSLPNHAFTSFAYYDGFGGLIAVLPWLGPRLQRVDPASLRSRLALALAATAALPLVITVTIISDHAEQASTMEALARQQALARAISQSVSEYVGLHEAAVAALAAQADLLTLPVEAQAARLRNANGAYPEIVTLATVDARGDRLARSDGGPLDNVAGQAIFREAQQGGTGREVRLSRVVQRPVLALAVPVRTVNGGMVGLVEATLDLDQLGQLLAQTGATPGEVAYLVDQAGRIVAHPNAELARALTDRHNAATVAAALAAGPASAATRATGPEGDLLAGYARVPSLGWSVVVERPAAAALASVRDGREVAFAVLFLVIAVAALAGIVIARWLARPLTVLAGATERLSGGDTAAPLPRSGVREIALLADTFAAMRDRLAERTAERERAIEAAEAAVALRDEFLSIAAHELKTPVTGMRGFAQVLLRRLQRNGTVEPDRLRQALTAIDEQSKRLGVLVAQLLDISRLEAGRLRLEPAPSDLAALVERVADLVQQTTDDHVLTVRADGPVLAEIDPLRFEQVVRNLLENAVKYSPNGGPILVAVARRPDRPEAVLTVRDHGLGISPERRGQIFDRFYRAHEEAFGGLGLGLYLSREIVALHGGTILAEFPEDGGTRFVVVLPGLAASAEPIAATHAD